MTVEPPFAVDPATLRARLAKMAELADLHRFAIIGRGKSGTTWLAKIFRSHPHAELLGERKLLEQTADYTPILRQFADPDVMAAWGQRTSFKLRLQPSRLGPELLRVAEDYLVASHLLHKEAEHAADPDFDPTGYGPITHVGDKLALNRPDDVAALLPVITLAYPGLRVVHIVRDGRDVAVSGFFHAYRDRLAAQAPGDTSIITDKVSAALEGRTDRLFTDPHLTVRARSWNDISIAVEDHLLEQDPERYLRVRYEDLLADPAAMVRTVYEFVGLDASPQRVGAAVERTSFASLSGRQAGEMEAASGMRKGVAGDWRNWFTPHDRELFAGVAQTALERFGYETDRTWVDAR